MAATGVDLGIFTETKITDGVYTWFSSGYNVTATNATILNNMVFNTALGTDVAALRFAGGGSGSRSSCSASTATVARRCLLAAALGGGSGRSSTSAAAGFRPWLLAERVLGGSVPLASFDDSAGWNAFNSLVEAQAGALRGPQGFVLDLRAAAGTSAYTSTARGYGLANRIWTPDFTVSRQPAAGEITYRATPGNRQWYAETLGRMRADPRFVQESTPVIEQTQAIVEAFDAALASGQQTFTLPGRPAVPDTGAPNPVQGPVIVLVDAGCSGGCLDTLDLLVRLPNVRIAGSTTATDTIFIEPTVQRLPSNYSDLSYGHKAWTSRARPNNQPFIPAQGLVYPGNPADETAVRTWVGTLFQ
jgi:hypothetical protein